MNDEIWKSINEFPNYEVSNYGNIRKNNKILRQYVTPKGYCRLQLSKNGKIKNLMVHRLVAIEFIKNHGNKPYINHKNGNKQDNNVSNLEWVTSSENLVHAYESGLKKAKIKFIIKCESLGLISHGCEKMEELLRNKGYNKAAASRIWSCINYGGKHLDLQFSIVKIMEN